MDCKVEEIKHYVSNIADPTECLCDLMDKLLQCERDVARSMEKCGESYSALGSIDNDACGQSISQVAILSQYCETLQNILCIYVLIHS